MSEKQLKFTVRFMTDSEPASKYVEETIKFFDNLKPKKFTHLITYERERECTDELSSKTDSYEITFIILCSNVKRESDVENFGAYISKQWCEKAKTNNHLHWLLPDKSNIFTTNYKSHYGNAKVARFSFGIIPDMKTFIPSYTFKPNEKHSSVLCTFSHLERQFNFFISNEHRNDCRQSGEMGHKMVIYYDSLIRIAANLDPSNEYAELFLHMKHPPLIYITHNEVENAETNGINKKFVTRISKAKEMEHGTEKFERAFSFGCSCNKTLCESKAKVGKTMVLRFYIKDKFQARLLIDQLILRRAKMSEILFTSFETVQVSPPIKALKTFPVFSRHKDFAQTFDTDKFNCDYAWEALNSRSLFVFYQIKLKDKFVTPKYSSFVKKELALCAAKNPSAVAKALFHLTDMVQRGNMFQFLPTFMKKFEYFCTFQDLIQLPKGMCYVRRVIISPSKIIILQPFEHFDNRIIREYGPEYMLRVSVQDDNLNRLTFAVQYNSDKDAIMKDVVGKIFNSGITIGDRHYEFLAASSSQLREHGVWMYAKDSGGNTAATIRNWMGDFSSITNVAKYMARMGQCLSTTEEGAQVSLESSSEFTLAESENDKYVFSDGIGVISRHLIEEVCAALSRNKGTDDDSIDQYQPSAFQIRYRGCKGMVALDPSIPGRSVGIRPSMKKFECISSNQLEIVKTSAPRKLFLNKQLITILEQKKVPKEAFIDLQSEMMLNLLDALIYEDKAESFLTFHLNGQFPFKRLHDAGVCFTNEPFFRSLLLSIFKSLVANLRSSMRIAIPENSGRNMMGVLDETGSLEYGQVFVQYTESFTCSTSCLKVLEGPVLVTKNPALHPGDVRRLTAVDVKALHHIKDCIVFPSQGIRPHPDEMAGGDLDGDEFVVLWHESLIFQEPNTEPMDYPTYQDQNLKKEIDVACMVDFFCHYIKNDCIGSFANAHLVWADKLKDGVFSRKCLKIAERYPYVLDFAKHGTTKYLKKSERPDQYPDFMQKGLSASSYYSTRVLGSLYRSSRVLDACSNKISLTLKSSLYDPDLVYSGWEVYIASAKVHKHGYIAQVSAVLQRYGLKSEAEAITGFGEFEFCRKWRNENTGTPQVVSSYIRNIMQTYRYIFLKELQKEIEKYCLNKEEATGRKYMMASAWYLAVYGEETEKVLSFPWILGDILAEIKQNRKCKDLCPNSFYHDIDFDVEFCIQSGLLECSSNNPSKCRCHHVTEAIFFKWISKAKLNIWANDKKPACKWCFERIMDHFKKNSGVKCCSNTSNDACDCALICSPCKLALKVLKFFVQHTSDSIGNCRKDCDGFISRNLQELSIQTLAYLTITRNIFHLGLDFNTSNFTKSAFAEEISEGIFYEEGDPIKIPVKTVDLKNIIETKKEEVEKYLKKNSGVKHLVMLPDRDLYGNFCLIVNSSGKNWQRWNLQEILLNSEFTGNLQDVIDLSTAGKSDEVGIAEVSSDQSSEECYPQN